MNEFSQSHDDAIARFEKSKSNDPLPNIPSALLNSADFVDYVKKTGMIHPFTLSAEKIKPASYEIDFLGEVYYWNDEAEERHFVIEKDTAFSLKKNSIAFVHLRTVFRLPDYIALRFNLKIKHVHRGLLLGTGPLIDPGFVGRLVIPLHNLTSADYVLVGGEGLIWVEFTKLSPNARWDSGSSRSKEDYFPFPTKKIDLQIATYLQKASNGKPIQSSIPGEVRLAIGQSAKAMEGASVAARNAEKSERTAQRLRRQIQTTVVFTVLATVIALAALTYQVLQITAETNSYVNEARKELLDTKRALEKTSTVEELAALRSRVQLLERAQLQKRSEKN